MRAKLMDEEWPKQFAIHRAELADDRQSKHPSKIVQTPNGELAEGGGESGKRAGRTLQARVPMVSQLEAVLVLYHNSHTVEAMVLATIQKKSEIKVQRKKLEAADGKLDLSDATDSATGMC